LFTLISETANKVYIKTVHDPGISRTTFGGFLVLLFTADGAIV